MSVDESMAVRRLASGTVTIHFSDGELILYRDEAELLERALTTAFQGRKPIGHLVLGGRLMSPDEVRWT